MDDATGRARHPAPVPGQSFIDHIGRRSFDNHAEYEALCGADRTIFESSTPPVTSGQALPDVVLHRIHGLPADAAAVV